MKTSKVSFEQAKRSGQTNKVSFEQVKRSGQTSVTSFAKKYNQGSTLIVTMIVLAMLMLLGVTTMMTSDTAFRLAGNLQFQDVAMNNAEAVLQLVEKDLENGANGVIDPLDPAFTGGTPKPGLIPRVLAADLLADGTWIADAANYADANVSGDYIIELMSQNTIQIGANSSMGGQGSSQSSRANTYRITVRSNSVRGASRTVQSYFAYVLP